MQLNLGLRTVIKDLALKAGVYQRTLFNVYPFMFAPNQLTVLDDCVGSVKDVEGCFVEAGCAFGATTVFLNKSMDHYGIDARYYAIDTFSGFVREHIKHEISARGKPRNIADEFRENKQSWFDRSLALHGVQRVKSVKSDITKFDFGAIGPIAFCLLDVDIYQPTQDVLPKIYDALAAGGVLVVDDCAPDRLYDGAQQAFDEFIASRGLEGAVVADKIGILRKPS